MGATAIVAIVGRPNVGKSSLFNRLVGRRQAIVEATSGVTRDRVHGMVQWGRHEFELVDTGGLHFSAGTTLSAAIVTQAKKAIDEADLLLFVVDIQTGITSLDREVMELIRKAGKKIILVVNKADNPEMLNAPHEFHELGLSDIQFVSASHGFNSDGVLDAIVEALGPKITLIDQAGEKALRIAVIGRPNVGKSSFINKLLQEQRVIVDNIPGTTRDTVDISFTFENTKYTLVDTAGIRRKKKPHEDIDFFSRTRTLDAIQHADVCIVLIDAQQGIRRDDLHIFSLINEHQKCCVIGFNKCDLVKITIRECLRAIAEQASFMEYAACVLCSATLGKNIHLALQLAQQSWNNGQQKIKQKKLSELVQEVVARNPVLCAQSGVKIHYLTQVKVQPPTFVIIVNRPELIKKHFVRFLEKELRRRHDFQGSPVVLLVKKKQRDKKKIQKEE
ncbi:MAG: ribosome biogenesis GTPase Der [Candidatus Omnitrophica bacterium]|nr:ribosome biogenesis GTPase Der [Candidatus Omnitrophota bacterium]